MPLSSISNPFDSELSRGHSNYCRPDGTHLLDDQDNRPSPLTELVHHGLRTLVLDEHFSCVAAKAALRQGGYRFGLYGELGSEAASAGLARDLFTFLAERDSFDSTFVTYVASFAGTPPPDETAFERDLWKTLQQLHTLDAPLHHWDTAVTSDASDRQFGFSFAGTALFVVGMHAASSRAARRFAWPTLVFNPHDQFEHLRSTGQYERFQQVIRSADQALDGSINPMLADFGERSEATQYSGRKVDAEWRCPFHADASRRKDGEA
ncbi:MAG TPA: guanitoxin biosynthesis heme-dependent pre-guanitoxin N-hydroxylase GntA [Vicinamibacterales bacterium]|nr:guanitoxin biosynthesis heme-dependent pre-guanitoxin N-hydroxylase GntA [Vicinamibacterales bacterium]